MKTHELMVFASAFAANTCYAKSSGGCSFFQEGERGSETSGRNETCKGMSGSCHTYTAKKSRFGLSWLQSSFIP